MKKNTVRGMILLAVVAAVFSLIAFVQPVEKTAVFWIAFGCGLFAVLFQLYIFKISFDGDAKSRFYGFPFARVGVYRSHWIAPPFAYIRRDCGMA